MPVFTPAEIARSYVEIGRKKAALPTLRLILLGILAGAFIALAGAGSFLGTVYVNKVVGAAIFPAGLAMVILAGSELFTGNCLLILPVLEKAVTVRQMLRNWVLVYAGNLLGAALVAAIAVRCGTFESVCGALITTAATKVSLPFGTALLRGVLCNVLVCLAVWMAMAAGDTAGKLLGLFFPVFLFVLCGYEHSVANMFYIPAGILAAAKYGMAASGLNLHTMWAVNLLPVTLGNIIGGCAVGAIYWVIYVQKPRE